MLRSCRLLDGFTFLLLATLPTFSRADDVSSATVSRLKREISAAARVDGGDRELEIIAGKIAEQDSAKSAVLLPVCGTVVESKRAYDRARDAIAQLKDEAAIEALARVAKKAGSKNWPQALIVLDGFSLRSDATSAAALIEGLEDKIQPVRLQAIAGCVSRKIKDSIPHLIDLVEAHTRLRDRTWYEAYTGLIALTGHDFETFEDWRKFWEGNRESIDPSNLKEKTSGTGLALKTPEDAVQFFGSELFSLNLCFVIDVSGSMQMYDEASDYKGKEIEKDRERLRRAKEQLRTAIELMPKAARFNIIAYNNSVKPWQDSTRPASTASVRAALKFVDELNAIEATHTDEALQKAFEDKTIDTVVLLSDGAPTRRGTTSANLIRDTLKWIQDVNAARKVRVLTFGFEGKGAWPENIRNMPPPPTPEEVKMFVQFLKDLAEKNAGYYRKID